MQKIMKWWIFWVFWLGGLSLFIGMVATSEPLATNVAPNGIIDHQSAGSSARVNAIYASWSEANITTHATTSMVVDLLFIGIYSFGGIVGALLLIRDSTQKALILCAKITLFLYVMFLLSDYTETISQVIQQVSGHGNDALAIIAATVQPIKFMAFFSASVATLIILIWHSLMGLRVG